MVWGSRLVLLHHQDDCKWICHLPRLQSTSALHQNQRICRVFSSGWFWCWDACCSFTLFLRPSKRKHSTLKRGIICDSCKGVHYLHLWNKLGQFSTVTLCCYGETFEILDFNEAPSSHWNGSNILGNSHRRTGKILLRGLNIICPNKTFWSQMHKMTLSWRQVFFAISWEHGRSK